jgi:(4-(4-[2-(gamma-L-glutamylamino)ethyl]phenoxymethyl)furan-2-yl)methanamine synthase
MIGIDVGGANTKLVDGRETTIHYCPLWEGASLTGLLQKYHDRRAAVVMSGELADCFSGKMEGIEFIVHAVKEAIPDALFYGTDACFHQTAVPQLAAANWLAAADYLRLEYPDAILVDMGSTTTDIIPLSRFDALKGLSDLQRLQQGYLVYTGLLRTNLAAALPQVVIGGIETATSSEYFATSADAHLVLGHISPDEYTCEAPDRGEKTREAALRRLARVVCAEPGEIGSSGTLEIAYQFWRAQERQIICGIGRVMDECDADTIITAGIGSSLLAKEMDAINLRDRIGEASDALPAFAVKEVALRDESA